MTNYGNPHSDNQGNGASSKKIEELRLKTLDFCQANESEYSCIITHGATSACKLVADCFPWTHGSIFAYLSDNHTSVLGMKKKAEQMGAVSSCIWNSKVDEFFEEIVCEKNVIRKGNCGFNLFVYPDESNFSGRKYPHEFCSRICSAFHGNEDQSSWKVMIDASKSCATNPPDLSRCQPDFVVVSYYKIFGFPTGLGALIVRKNTLKILKKDYFGGGTVSNVLVDDGKAKHTKLRSGPAGFEDGTPSFLLIPSALWGLRWSSLMQKNYSIRLQTFTIAKKLARGLKELIHSNKLPVCQLYGMWNQVLDSSLDVDDAIKLQSPTICFNIRNSDGNWIGYRQVERLAALDKIFVRSGGLCNPGALQEALQLTNGEIVGWDKAGHSCDELVEIVNGNPTGAVRISFGYASSLGDADKILGFVSKNFVEAIHPHKIQEETKKTTRMLLESLYIYPVKSCAGQRVESWPLEEYGLLYDRTLKLVDSNQKTLTLKREPKLMHIRPEINLKEKKLQLSCGNSSIALTLNDVDFDKASTWFTSVLGRWCQLVDCNNHNGDRMPRKSFANSGSLLVLNRSSLNHLHASSRLEEDAEIFERRFRPNMVVGGPQKFFSEDFWEEIRSQNKLLARRSHNCRRCDLVGFCPRTGEMSRKEPLQALKSMRGDKGQAKELLSFGVIFDAVSNSVVEEGMVLQIIS